MAIKYTDVALAQQPGVNFPGQPGNQQLTNPPSQYNNPIFENDQEIVATYTMDGTEAANDTIYISKLEAGIVVDPNGKVSSGLTAPATTLTLSIGDNDLGNPALLPSSAIAALQAAATPPSTSLTAPIWVSGTSYVLGNVVQDATANTGSHNQYDTYLCVSNTSGATAPNAAATTVWMPCRQRYSGSINPQPISSNVSFTGGTQMYGGPASLLPYAVTPGQVALGLTAAQVLNQQYQIQNDCWLFARILTASVPVANAVLVFRVPVLASN